MCPADFPRGAVSPPGSGTLPSASERPPRRMTSAGPPREGTPRDRRQTAVPLPCRKAGGVPGLKVKETGGCSGGTDPFVIGGPRGGRFPPPAESGQENDATFFILNRGNEGPLVESRGTSGIGAGLPAAGIEMRNCCAPP
jgi:hypothetical protein